ncbi:nucleotide-binding protein [Archaeoglobus veneficus]|uniref:Cobyrinic acid ac-diamide synthase n=1 Tax=Archaeoglobus veneficus (strain DSM 11195 / SNP6) TaxID=693661 RepID=F2KRA9_ARCVS|nr:AAA family ATPase [Archaeoglobus veneficus]AEA47843.1 Cobyrinic acid ac-diamide synthase [Archaeoglobus veneficus SNP6]
MPVLAICSGKGGVGKTTVSANLAVVLTLFGRVIVIDSDIALPNLHTFFGLDDPFISLLDVLKDMGYLKDAIYEIRVKLKDSEDMDVLKELHVLPASTSVKALEEIDMERFKDVIESLRKDYDFVIVDVAAGLSKYAIIPMLSADASYLVVNPEKASIIDSQKVRKIADVSGVRVGGIIINRYKGEKRMVEYAENAIGAEVVGIIRESKLVRECWEDGIPVTMRKPYSKVAKDFYDLARRLVGEDVDIRPYGRLKYLFG